MGAVPSPEWMHKASEAKLREVRERDFWCESFKLCLAVYSDRRAFTGAEDVEAASSTADRALKEYKLRFGDSNDKKV